MSNQEALNKQVNKFSAEKIIIDPNTMKELVCEICNNYLSVSPIYYVDDIGFTCGRCEDDSALFEKTTNPLKERQWLYEKLAKSITFPCMNEFNGCDIKLQGEEVKKHEEFCIFSRHLCLFAYGNYGDDEGKECDWIGEFEELNQHLEEVHSSKFVDLPIKFKVKDDYLERKLKSKLILTKVSGEVCVVLFQFSETFNCCVMSLKSNQKINNASFKLQIMDGYNAISSDLQPIKIKKFPSLSYVETLRIRIVDISFLTNFSFISLDIIKHKMNNGTTSLVMNNVTNCDSCKKRLFPPSYICKENHKACEACYKNQIFPICRSLDHIQTCCDSFVNNESFDNICKIIILKCKNYVKGCSYTNNYIHIRTHEEHCSFKKFNCDYENCSWKGLLKDFYTHLEKEHITRIFHTYYTITKSIDNCYFLFDNQVFRFLQFHTVRKTVPGSFLNFLISCITQQENSVTYLLEMNFRNSIRPYKESLSLKYFIKPPFMEFADKRFTIQGEFLQQFGFDENLEFSIDISRL